jgi:ferredoxin
MVTFESEEARQGELVKGIVTSSGGSLSKDADAQKAWDNRFNHLNLKRLGPSVVVAESVMDVERLGEGIDAAAAASRVERSCIWCIAISPREFDIIYYALDNEHRATYALATGNALAVIDAVTRAGGRSYSTGVLASDHVKNVLGKERLKQLKAWRKETDKKEVFNPGPVVGARTRLMPLPVHDFPLQLRLASPLLKLQRGWFEYGGSDPQWLAQQRALGRVHAGELGELGTEVTTCIFCGMCNAVAPEGKGNPWETALPRGRVQLAKAVIEGRVTGVSPRAHRNVAWTSLQHNPDSICPVSINIQRVTDLLLAAAVKSNGALPEHLALAESYESNGNPYGQPKDKRGAWVNIGFDLVSTTVFVADDAAAYQAPEVAQSAAAILANAGYPVAHMGKADAGSAAVLFETGQREAAAKAVTPFLEALAKRGATAIVTPDASGARAMAVDWPIVAAQGDVAAPQAQHTGTVVAELLRAKKIEMEKKLGKKAVVHVPEGLTAVQRAAVMEVAKAVGAEIIDAPHHECGTGRGLDKLDPALHQRIAEEALKAAVASGAQAILTMSPGCTTTLRNAAKKAKAGIEVLDLHVVVAQQMKASAGGIAAPVAVQEEKKAPVEPEIPPDHYRVEFVKEATVLAVHKNQSILEAGTEAGLDLPSQCKAGTCDTCSARWEGTPPDQSAGSALTPEQQKTFVLTCIARPKGPVKIWSDERPK